MPSSPPRSKTISTPHARLRPSLSCCASATGIWTRPATLPAQAISPTTLALLKKFDSIFAVLEDRDAETTRAALAWAESEGRTGEVSADLADSMALHRRRHRRPRRRAHRGQEDPQLRPRRRHPQRARREKYSHRRLQGRRTLEAALGARPGSGFARRNFVCHSGFPANVLCSLGFKRAESAFVVASEGAGAFRPLNMPVRKRGFSP